MALYYEILCLYIVYKVNGISLDSNLPRSQCIRSILNLNHLRGILISSLIVDEFIPFMVRSLIGNGLLRGTLALTSLEALWLELPSNMIGSYPLWTSL